MNAVQQQMNHDSYRLVLIDASSSSWLLETVSESVGLPQISIPKLRRPADEISREILSRWGFKSVLLDCFSSGHEANPLAVAEVVEELHISLSLGSYSWYPIRDFIPRDLNDKEVAAVMGLLHGDSVSDGPFARLGWLREAVSWLHSELPRNQFEFSGDFHQFNGTGHFCLIRLGNKRGPAHWLKATGEPNHTELSITRELLRCSPQHLPSIVATKEMWNAWVMEDVGERLDEPLVHNQLEIAVSSLAELQKATIGECESLQHAGCTDQRGSVLVAAVPALLEYMLESMAAQSSTRVPQLNKTRIRELECVASAACAAMASLAIPTTILHNDFTPGNVLCDGPRCVFIDWAEGAIGNPILTYQHLRSRISRESYSSNWLAELDARYIRCWSDTTTTHQMTKALKLAPVVALISHLFGRGSWLRDSKREAPHLKRYARVIARHLDVAAHDSELVRSL